MLKLPKWKILTSIICTVLAIIYALPNFTTVNSGFLPNDKVNLGLDLRGGSHLLLEVDFDNYMQDTMENLGDRVKKYFRDEKIGFKNLKIVENHLQLELRNDDAADKAKKIISKIDSGIKVSEKNGLLRVEYSESRLDSLRDRVIDQSIEIIRMRVDSTGTREPIIHRQGDSYILLQVPGENDPQRLKNVLGKTAKLTFHLVDETANIQEALKGNIPAGSIQVSNESGVVVIKKKAIINGDQLTNAQATFTQNSLPAVDFEFNNFGSKIFAEVTKHNRGKRLAIVLDNKLLSAPVINEPILGGKGIISGNFTVESANDLALMLRAGALPAPLKIIEERSIGPNLGADSIESGKNAGIIGFIAVTVFMFLSYGTLGIFANISLVLALLYILALLSLFQATLTLPGIAGIILTIGMAVDANVLIYERIREELQKGSSNLYAIKLGFETAFATIADSNITTLIAAFILYAFGVGAIKGFAVTLTIGILASMFTAIIITKLLIDIWVKYFNPKNLGL